MGTRDGGWVGRGVDLGKSKAPRWVKLYTVGQYRYLSFRIVTCDGRLSSDNIIYSNCTMSTMVWVIKRDK